MRNKSTIALFLTSVFLLSYGVSAQNCTEAGSILRVKNRSAGNVEYVIFDVKKHLDGYEFGYEVEDASPPFTDYPGEETYTIAGDKYKRIVFRSIYWMCTTREQFSLPKRAVRGIKLLWSFEGINEYAIGYSSGSRYVTTYSYDAGSVTKVVMKFKVH